MVMEISQIRRRSFDIHILVDLDHQSVTDHLFFSASVTYWQSHDQFNLIQFNLNVWMEDETEFICVFF